MRSEKTRPPFGVARRPNDGQLVAYLEPGLVEVDVGPSESADLAAAHPSHGRHAEQRAERLVRGQVEEGAQLGRCPPRHLRRLRVLGPRWVRHRGDVASEITLADGIAEGLLEHGVDVPDRTRAEATLPLP